MALLFDRNAVSVGKEKPVRWSAMTPDERNKLVADIIMDGEMASYTEDLRDAWKAYEVLASTGVDTRTIHLYPLGEGAPCGAIIGPLQPGSVVVSAPTPAQAICITALMAKSIEFEDGNPVFAATHNFGAPDTHQLAGLNFS